MNRSTMLFEMLLNRPTDNLAAFLRDVGIPGKTLIDIDNALQQRFFQRDASGRPKERWELNEVQIGCPKEKILRHLELLGFIARTIPENWKAKYAVWPGGMGPRAWVRLSDLIDAWNSGVRWQQTVVHGGKRKADLAKEGYAAMAKAMNLEDTPGLRAAWGDNEPATELEVMQCIWSLAAHACLIPAELQTLTPVLVDAPMKPHPEFPGDRTKDIRPDSEDVIRHWLRTEKPAAGIVLLSSGAPYGMAQHFAFQRLLPDLFSVETFGHAAPDLPVENLMREVAGAVNRMRKLRIG